jgi:hypothetical protein
MGRIHLDSTGIIVKASGIVMSGGGGYGSGSWRVSGFIAFAQREGN